MTEWQRVEGYGKNPPGTKSGWFIYKAKELDVAETFHADVHVKYEHHDDLSGPLHRNGPRSTIDSFFGINYDEEGEPIIEAAGFEGSENPEACDVAREFASELESESSQEEQGVKELDLPVFDVAVEIDGSFYGVKIYESAADFYQPQDYDVIASNEIDTPVETQNIPNEDQETVQELARQFDGDFRVENAVEELREDYIDRNFNLDHVGFQKVMGK